MVCVSFGHPVCDATTPGGLRFEPRCGEMIYFFFSKMKHCLHPALHKQKECKFFFWACKFHFKMVDLFILTGPKPTTHRCAFILLAQQSETHIYFFVCLLGQVRQCTRLYTTQLPTHTFHSTTNSQYKL